MADYDRYSNPNRDRDRERRERFREARLDDRTGYGPGSPGGYRAERSYQGDTRDYGRDDERSSTYGGFEDRSFANESSPYYSGENDAYGYDRPPYRASQSAREYQTNDKVGLRPNYDSAGFGGRQRSVGRPAPAPESYAFTPYEGYGGIGRDFGFGHHERDEHRRHGRDHDRNVFDRAVERVQSWFSPDDRRGAHSGRGPKGYRRSDDRIREDVSDRLADDSWLDAADVEVIVADCEVTLVGTVPDREAKRRAEHLADDIAGVKHVQNNLRISQLNRGTETPVVIESEAAGIATSPTLDKQAAGRA